MASSVNINQNQLIIDKEIAHYRGIWQHVCSDLSKYYGDSLYKSWFSKLNFLEASTTTVILSTPTNFIRDWIKSRYARAILQSWQSYDKDIKLIEIVTKELLEQNSNIPEYLVKIRPMKEGIDLNIEGIFSTLDLRFTFENFVVGGPNELAYAASRAVAESESAVAESNPLFLYGGVGLGKTHLMHAIAWYIRHNNPTRKVIYMSAEKFMYQFIKALCNKDVMSFKEEFRSVDVLMIDDIQFISGKDSTQEEFFHTFNALIDNNRQMVISCDRSPSDLDNIEDRIKSRLGCRCSQYYL